MSSASTDTMKTLNFLLQATAQEAEERPILGATCGATMKRIAMKNVVRTTRAVKDVMCSACGALLSTKKKMPASSVSLRVRGGCAVVACSQCGHIKRCPLPTRKPKNLQKDKKKPKYKHKTKQKSIRRHEQQRKQVQQGDQKQAQPSKVSETTK